MGQETGSCPPPIIDNMTSTTTCRILLRPHAAFTKEDTTRMPCRQPRNDEAALGVQFVLT